MPAKGHTQKAAKLQKERGSKYGKRERDRKRCEREREREKWKDKTRLQMCKQQFPKVSFLLLLLFESESASVPV